MGTSISSGQYGSHMISDGYNAKIIFDEDQIEFYCPEYGSQSVSWEQASVILPQDISLAEKEISSTKELYHIVEKRAKWISFFLLPLIIFLSFQIFSFVMEHVFPTLGFIFGLILLLLIIGLSFIAVPALIFGGSASTFFLIRKYSKWRRDLEDYIMREWDFIYPEINFPNKIKFLNSEWVCRHNTINTDDLQNIIVLGVSMKRM